ncbi:PREDICTED: arylsulfatase H [Hipposideros armiger]|uniref:Arylsulfatase H n=1 Tax=Hipposideros armiger TaxID=186990 RepID=A0A8B7Q2I5_HIPAR|nr:PREDICTED: arylsulfatase H [Hipposideros armiger]
MANTTTAIFSMVFSSPAVFSALEMGNCWLSLTLCCLFGGLNGTFVTRNSRPNIVLLMADDLGVGDLGCYGNYTMSTPNIDRLAREGVKLTQHLAAASVCTPSRAAFLTGRYPIRSGKWHQGLSCASRDDHCYHPLNHGFDYFYGLPLGLLSDCQASETPELHSRLRVQLCVATAGIGLASLLLLVPKLAGWLAVPWTVIVTVALLALLFFASWYASYGFTRRWNCVLMRNHEILQQPMREDQVSMLMLKEALSFIDRYKHGPFLLLFCFLHVHTPLTTQEKFVGHSKHGRYGDNVEEMDWMVGKILEALDQERLTKHTLVYFTSDNGGRLEAGGAQLGGWNGLYKGDTVGFRLFCCGVSFSPEGAGACYGSDMCSCTTDVTYHDPPLLFDVSRDPSEVRPLSPDNEALFHSVVQKVEAAVKEHRKTLTPAPLQLSVFNTLWKPWLQPCCGTFPFCGCDKEDDIIPNA